MISCQNVGGETGQSETLDEETALVRLVHQAEI